MGVVRVCVKFLQRAWGDKQDSVSRDDGQKGERNQGALPQARREERLQKERVVALVLEAQEEGRSEGQDCPG